MKNLSHIRPSLYAFAFSLSLCGLALYVRPHEETDEPTPSATAEHFARLLADAPVLEGTLSGFGGTVLGRVSTTVLPDVVSGASGSSSSSSGSSSSGSGSSGDSGAGGGDKCNDALTKQCEDENSKAEKETCKSGDWPCESSFKNHTNPASRIPYEGNDAKGKDKGNGSKGSKKCVSAKESGNCAQKCGRGGYSETPDTSSTGLKSGSSQCKDGGDSNTDICRQDSSCPKESGGGGGGMPCIPMPSQQKSPENNGPVEDPCKSPFASKLSVCNTEAVKKPPTCSQFVAEPTKIYRGESTDLKWVVQAQGSVKMQIKYITINDKGRPKVGALGSIGEGDTVTEFPKYTTTYSLVIKNEAGTKTCPPVKVTVYPSDSSKAFSAPEDEENDEDVTSTDSTEDGEI